MAQQMTQRVRSPKYEALIKDCEDSLRSGRGQLLRTRLSGLNTNRIPRIYRQPIANFCRRAGLNQTGLRILSPIIHPTRKISVEEPSPSELAEYSILLSRVGLVQEAFWTLDKVDTTRAPEASLFRAHFHFGRWEYEEALPHLQRYLETDLSPYARLVGQVNLAAALVQTRAKAEALELLDSCIEWAKREQHRRLWLNALELKTEMFIQEEDFHQARLALKQAQALSDDKQVAVDSFYVEIWQAVLNGLESNDPAPLLQLRNEANRRGLWERVREIDFYLCKIESRSSEPDLDRFNYLVFGTPHKAFRNRVTSQTGLQVESESYIYGNPTAPCVDVTAGNIVGLKPGKKVHQVLDVVLRDFYRPASVGALFSELYPTERFNVQTSPARVHQLLSRTRVWLQENEIPAVLKSENNGVQMELTDAFSFCVPLERTGLNTFGSQWARLKKTFPADAEFTASEARETIGLKPSSFKSLIRWALNTHQVDRFGQSVSTKYKMK